ncbi:hypothetical protein M409DRAFT_48399 [Zasmidium cellare ATCC 36951]|uniref:MYND-type domain-containing protein n=1 Tax=Zasmidium cellare ATCC 36951 TaxID=1080233 RepID=A0A6A6D1W7_ZASCE|nr:uncharacterized protein M409DRAFT_48399 [Zasmidium cellare ATCC 36951]KAF2173417.1 hypothetical protein M409DRAFT_48399 [Zasmidium cellare ATCC 36951]
MANSREESSNGAPNEAGSIGDASSSSKSQAQDKLCANCSKAEDSPDPTESPNLKPCISCKSVLYCSRDCKKAHTKKHKKVCAALAQEYFKTNGVTMASRAPPKTDTHRGGLQKWQFDT